MHAESFGGCRVKGGKQLPCTHCCTVSSTAQLPQAGMDVCGGPVLREGRGREFCEPKQG